GSCRVDTAEVLDYDLGSALSIAGSPIGPQRGPPGYWRSVSAALTNANRFRVCVRGDRGSDLSIRRDLQDTPFGAGLGDVKVAASVQCQTLRICRCGVHGFALGIGDPAVNGPSLWKRVDDAIGRHFADAPATRDEQIAGRIDGNVKGIAQL